MKKKSEDMQRGKITEMDKFFYILLFPENFKTVEQTEKANDYLKAIVKVNEKWAKKQKQRR